MSTFTVKFDCDNDAFGTDDFTAKREIARILRIVAARVENDHDGMQCWETILDSNGNDIGRFALKDFPSQGMRKERWA